MAEEKNSEIEIDLKEIFYVLLSKLWIVILMTALGIGIAAGYTAVFIQPIYSSTSILYVLTKSTSITSLADIQMGSSLTQDYMVFIKSRPVAEKVIEELELDTTYKKFVSNVTVENPANTRFLNITVKNHDAYMAKVIVDKLTDVSAGYMAEVMETQKPNVMDYGHVAEQPFSPSMAKNAMLGAVLGLVLSVGCIIVLYLMNDAVQTTEDVEKYLGMNTLGLIPLEEGVSKRRTQGHVKEAIRVEKSNRQAEKRQKQRVADSYLK